MKKKNIRINNSQKNSYYDVCINSNIGKRESQQDAAYVAVNDKSVFAVVCDGMGGMNGGERASFTAVEAFAEFYLHANGISVSDQWMQSAVESVDDIVFKLTDENGKKLSAGTTLVSVNLNYNNLHWVSVGDSRIYIFRKNEMVQITTDHNYYIKLDDDLKNGMITQEEYDREAIKGEALISFIGMGGLVLTDINAEPFPLVEGDTILLCTDGVYRTVPEDCLKQIIIRCKNMKEASEWIQQYVELYGTDYQDNYTYVLIRVCGKE